MNAASLRAAIEALPVHPIGGYEWECRECDYWFSGDERWGDTPREDRREAYHDSQGNECSHEDLLDKRLVLALLDATDRMGRAIG